MNYFNHQGHKGSRSWLKGIVAKAARPDFLSPHPWFSDGGRRRGVGLQMGVKPATENPTPASPLENHRWGGGNPRYDLSGAVFAIMLNFF
jgi:hypothetical protein